MGFTQTFIGPVTNVYNVEGTLILSAESQAPDLVRELTAMRTQLASLPGLAEVTRNQADASIAAAEAEGKAAKPNGTAIKDHLENAAKTIESASGLAESATKFAKVLIGIGKWAAVLLL